MAGALHLTNNERKVAQAILRGEPATKTCERLRITKSRYKTHVKHMLEKTQSRGQVELVAKLRESIAHV